MRCLTTEADIVGMDDAEMECAGTGDAWLGDGNAVRLAVEEDTAGSVHSYSFDELRTATPKNLIEPLANQVD